MAIYEKAIEGITSLFSELITDDDLRAKLDFKVDQLRFELDKELLKTTTTPKMDAFVKLLIATRDIIIPLVRPIGSLLMALFGAWCISEGIVLSDALQVTLFGAPLAYGTSRHIDKTNKEKTRRRKIEVLKSDDEFWDDD